MTASGIAARDHRERFGVQGEHRAQVLEVARLRESVGALVRVILPVRLGEPELQPTGTQMLDVVNRAASTLHQATKIFRVLIDDAAHGAAARIVDRRDATRTDDDKRL